MQQLHETDEKKEDEEDGEEERGVNKGKRFLSSVSVTRQKLSEGPVQLLAVRRVNDM